LHVVLIEVTKKKIQYLMDLIKILELEDIEIQSLDWRTFLRKSDTKIDLFVTRAAIDEVELIRAFKPACFNKNSQIAYWTVQEWECHTKAMPFIKRVEDYKLGSKHRKIVFLGL
jgi:16S rRNA G527 N7-methylase RsmG